LFSSVSTRRVIGSLHDLAVAVCVFLLSHMLVLGVPRTLEIPNIGLRVAIFGLAAAIIFQLFQLNRGAWRYASLPDLLSICKAATTLVVLYSSISFLVDRGADLPRSVPPIMLVFLIVGMSGPRLAYRLFKENRLGKVFKRSERRNSDGRLLLLYGLTNQSESFLRALSRTPEANLRVVGILDDAFSNRKLYVHGAKVLGTLEDLGGIVDARARGGLKISELVIGDRNLNPEEMSRIVGVAVNVGLTVSMLPDMTSLHQIQEKPPLEPKPINLTDLLGRPEIKFDNSDIAKLVNEKVVLITGAGGSIGSELVRQVAGFNPRLLILTDSSEHFLYTIDLEMRETFPALSIESYVADVRDAGRITKLFERSRPDLVFHAAALKQVPLVEDNPVEAIKTNVIGTKNVADAALATQARSFVMISTDKAVNPTNIMGATKRAAEAYCQMLDLKSEKTRFKTVRFGNVMGSNGSVVPRFRDQIARGGPVTVTHPEIVRFFMSIPEAVRLVLQASSQGWRTDGERGKILVLDMGKPHKIVDLATKMIQLAGFRPGIDIKIEFSGLRPGEKLYEELFDDTEIVSPPTGHGYSLATPRVTNDKLLQKRFSEMRTAAEADDEVNAVKLLLHIVPEYTGSMLRVQAEAEAERALNVASKTLPWPGSP
jgi:FlaA1/EpsC-like NDP-sugar epimerase